MTPAPIWRLAPGQRLLYRCWDGECVLYNDLSGDTHLLDEFALALLEQVQRAPQAAAQLAAAFGLDPDADLAAGTDAPHADYPVLEDDTPDDFDVLLRRPRGLRRLVKPQVFFHYDGMEPFQPLPLAQLYPMFEWAMNWCVSSHAHSWLVIHAAVVEKEGAAVILPAPPGSGKSTLCAALVARGWRLLSDELTLVRLDDGRVDPVPRPLSLKNASSACWPGADEQLAPADPGAAHPAIHGGARRAGMGTAAAPGGCCRPRRHAGPAGRRTRCIHALPPRVQRRLGWECTAWERHGQVVRFETWLVRRALLGTGLPLILLKGTAYVAAGLPAAAGRLFSDIDLLVPKERLAEVESLLMAHGWVSTHHDAYDQRYYRE